eukprot:NODE_9245_length_1437_cov_4.560305.p1 GENE.NODE_9245_length_1437_cov_4.560305~~NODE_9245_length_1437_cov_4.560305.p1  ORF type:complete len:336 (-),score=100.89 NODE_9245_length_1437_cov_4.560305:185-1192(-)
MAAGPPSHFAVSEGGVVVRHSATVICLRNVRSRGATAAPGDNVLRARELGTPEQLVTSRQWLQQILKGGEEREFASGWEVLMGQNECVNWLRTPGPADHPVRMRYAGEYKFAGGNLDKGEGFMDAARRELTEEFLKPAGISLPESAVLRPFVAKQTRPVLSRSYIMYNMVALAEENPWLASLDTTAVNRELAERRDRFWELMRADDYWRLSESEREAVAPEVHELQWLPLRDAVFHCCASAVQDGTLHRINEWQRDELERLGVGRRDPMVLTAVTLTEIEAFRDVVALIEHCAKQPSDEVSLRAAAARVQWLPNGASPEETRRLMDPRVARGVRL